MIAELATNFTVAPPEVVFSDTGAGGAGFTTVPSGAITSMGFSAPCFRQIIGECAENRLATGAEGRMVWQLMPFLACGLLPVKSNSRRSSLLSLTCTSSYRQRECYRCRSMSHQESRQCVCAGSLRNSAAFLTPQSRVRAELLVQRLHARFRHIVRRDLARGDQANHHRLARHVDERIEEIFSQLAAVDQLNAGNANAFVQISISPRRVAARRHRANVHDVDKVALQPTSWPLK